MYDTKNMRYLYPMTNQDGNRPDNTAKKINAKFLIILIVLVLLGLGGISAIVRTISHGTDSGLNQNQLMQKTVDLGIFENIILENGQTITIKNIISTTTNSNIYTDPETGAPIENPLGSEYKTILIGKVSDIDQIKISNNDKVLTISKKQVSKYCFFCENNTVQIEVQAPLGSIKNIETRNSK